MYLCIGKLFVLSNNYFRNNSEIIKNNYFWGVKKVSRQRTRVNQLSQSLFDTNIGNPFFDILFLVFSLYFRVFFFSVSERESFDCGIEITGAKISAFVGINRNCTPSTKAAEESPVILIPLQFLMDSSAYENKRFANVVFTETIKVENRDATTRALSLEGQLSISGRTIV